MQFHDFVMADLALEKETDHSKPAYAFYIKSNPEEMSEFWQLIDKHAINPKAKAGYRLGVAHFSAAPEILERKTELYRGRYGEIACVGMTYNVEPYMIGIKREAPFTPEEDALLRRTLTRENYTEIMAQNLLEMPELLKEQNLQYASPDMVLDHMAEIVNNFSEEEFQYRVDRFIQNKKDVSCEISKKQAWEKVWEYYENSPYAEKAEFEKSLAWNKKISRMIA